MIHEVHLLLHVRLQFLANQQIVPTETLDKKEASRESFRSSPIPTGLGKISLESVEYSILKLDDKQNQIFHRSKALTHSVL